MAPIIKLADLRKAAATRKLAQQLKPADKNKDGQITFKELATLPRAVREAAADHFVVEPEVALPEPPGPLGETRKLAGPRGGDRQ